MSLKQLKLLTIALPTLLIGGFEYVRHDFLLHYLSMQTGNFFITLLTLLLAYLFASWVFRRFERINLRLAEEQTKRAVYEERERLARELHDTIAQTLFFLNVKLKQGKLDEARSAVADIDNHVRQAIFNLRTPMEDGSCFETRLQKWLREWGELTGIALHTELNVPEQQFSRAEELQLFAIVQEACTNIRKHSSARNAAVTLRVKGTGRWLLEITDDGVGPQEVSKSEAGKDQGQEHASSLAASVRGAANRYGLSMIRKRAEELGAACEFGAAGLSGGTRLTIYKGGRSRS